MTKEELTDEGGVLARSINEVLAPAFCKDRVRAPSVFVGFGSFDQAGPFEPINKSTRAAVGQDTFGSQCLDPKSPIVLEKQPEQNLVFGMTKACCAAEVLLKAFGQSSVRRQKSAPCGGFGVGERIVHTSEVRRSQLSPSSSAPDGSALS